jgi:hypothetical protein
MPAVWHDWSRNKSYSSQPVWREKSVWFIAVYDSAAGVLGAVPIFEL